VIDVAHAPVRRYATIDSTNTEARRLHQADELGPLWILADEQTAGRGRLERRWASEKGNLYCTLLYPFDDASPLSVMGRGPPMTGHGGVRVPQVGFAVALAVADVADRYADNVKLKWPNDVLINGAKVSGILCEVLSQDTLAVGCGINVAHAPKGLPYPVTHLANANRDDVFVQYRTRLSHWLNVWNSGFMEIREAWLSRAIGIGEPVSMTIGDQTHTGTLEGIDDMGALIIRQSDNTHLTLHAGDLVIPSLQAQRKQSA
jgi:BirA family transcriptional regulator, biotin operon repressor / biotin---[acetyl-CoA-carboxylase] ligase